MSDEVQALLHSAVVWDNHGCMPLRADASFLPQLERYRNSGVNVVALNVGFADISWVEHLRVLSFMRRWIAQRPECYRLVSTRDDIRRCKSEGQLGVFFDVEGMCPVQDDLSFVQTFYELGVRWMLIAYNRSNKAGGGCLDTDTGLTDLGREIIDEMERVGMVLCLSHTGARTAREALQYSRNPVIFSHSNAYAVHAHPRNISDELIKACAASGGVVGVNGIGRFLGDEGDPAELWFRHVDHMVQMVGPDHVGIALDYVFDVEELQGYYKSRPDLFALPRGDVRVLPSLAPEQIPVLVQAMVDHQYSDEAIVKILGGNHLRVAAAVWK